MAQETVPRRKLTGFRSGEIRVLDSIGNIERTIVFDEADQKL